MAAAMMSWLLALPMLGFATGLRTFTPMAVLCWFSYMDRMQLEGTWAAWTGKLSVAIVFTVLALGEWLADKLPGTPNRTAAGPLLGRLVMGGLVGSIAATSMRGPGLEGVMLGVLGAALGTFTGFMIRRELVQRLQCADWPVALFEDLLTLGAAVFAMHVVTA